MNSKIIDLTMFLSNETPVYPGDPKPDIKTSATIDEQGWNEKSLKFNSHFSTHIDAPFHILKNGKKLDDYPIESFIGEAVVIDVRNQEEINCELDNVKENDFVFLFTGHTDKAGTEKFFESYPVVSLELAKKLVNKKVSVVGLDSLTPDKDPFPVHKMLFNHDIRIVENLINLKELAGKRFKCIIAPLKIKNADGAPCRVIAII